MDTVDEIAIYGRGYLKSRENRSIIEHAGIDEDWIRSIDKWNGGFIITAEMEILFCDHEYHRVWYFGNDEVLLSSKLCVSFLEVDLMFPDRIIYLDLETGNIIPNSTVQDFMSSLINELHPEEKNALLVLEAQNPDRESFCLVMERVDDEKFSVVIEEDHIVELSLANFHLDQIPEVIQSLTHLRRLILNYNRISFIPQWLNQFQALQELKLVQNSIKSLSSDINLNSLNTLILEDNHLQNFQISNHFPNLKHLYLGENLLESLTIQSKIAPELEILYLYDNRLENLPALNCLSKVNKVNIAKNRLRNLPINITQLQNLKFLDVSENKLSSLPTSFGSLKTLIHLNLSGNPFQEFPCSLLSLNHLKSLDVSQTELDQIPENIHLLRDLESLILYGNKIKNIPETMGKLHMLRKLDASNNQLQNIPLSLSELTKLEYLYLSNNMLRTLPDQLETLQSLISLHLSKNMISIFPGCLSNLNSLKELIISNNPLRSIPQISSPFPPHSVFFNNCPISKISKRWTEIEEIFQFSFQEVFDLICHHPKNHLRLKYITRLWIENPSAFVDLIIQKLSVTLSGELHSFLQGLLSKLTLALENGTELLL